MKLRNLYISPQDLRVEHCQLIDEGRDLGGLEREFERLEALSEEELLAHQDRCNALLDEAARLPRVVGYPYHEPSDLESIRAARPGTGEVFDADLDERDLFDRVHGAWLGRAAGCLLGKPVEGWLSARMWGFLQDLGKYPLGDYFRCDVDPGLAEKYEIRPERGFINLVDHMPEDDDTNYTVAGLLILKKHGADFRPHDVAGFWLENLPVLHTWTAERVAYRNFLNGVDPPASATCRNPYREWIGAQIRADFYGYAAQGNPELAAEMAWRDASVSHVKNGIYGSMWVAAMLAAAPFLRDTRHVIEAGLAQIPARCRLAEAIAEVIGWHGQGDNFEQAVGKIHRRWDETFPHHWCHTVSNAQVVALGLLWGGGDFEKSVCRAVQACFDTDCNGATVGSLAGMMLGAHNLPQKWTGPLNNRLETGLAGYNLVELDSLAAEGLEVSKRIRKMRQT
ncbi:MAG: ADP-ribosylglycohydrolase family protein [Candidatus Glassbacteria bacterium]|nr:ADP-ribosylglycohydrolase family protein [Candidatus Glassbacteria bacterium]